LKKILLKLLLKLFNMPCEKKNRHKAWIYFAMSYDILLFFC
jgi:hypothetical protein